MPIHVPVPAVLDGDTYATILYNNYLAANMNKLLNTGHRVLSVAAFTALTAVEDGDEVYLEVDATNGIIWHLRYVATETTYFWRFLGGPPMVSEVTTSEATSSTTYAALTTGGPSISLPRAGDYDVHTGFDSPSGTGGVLRMSFNIGGTGAVDADAAAHPGGGTQASVSRTRRKTGIATSTLTAVYKNASASSANYENRTMRVTPVRIRHDA